MSDTHNHNEEHKDDAHSHDDGHNHAHDDHFNRLLAVGLKSYLRPFAGSV